MHVEKFPSQYIIACQMLLSSCSSETNQVILDVEAGENPLPRSGHWIMADGGNICAIGGYIQFSGHLIVKGEI